MIRNAILAASLALALSGCIPLLIGGLVGYELTREANAPLVCQPLPAGGTVCQRAQATP